jgi:hypothetical protein
MFLKDFLKTLFHIFPKSLIMIYEIFSPRGYMGASSGLASDFAFNESEAKPLFQGLN